MNNNPIQTQTRIFQNLVELNNHEYTRRQQGLPTIVQRHLECPYCSPGAHIIHAFTHIGAETPFGTRIVPLIARTVCPINHNQQQAPFNLK